VKRDKKARENRIRSHNPDGKANELHTNKINLFLKLLIESFCVSLFGKEDRKGGRRINFCGFLLLKILASLL
jgi:hypothetical protein